MAGHEVISDEPVASPCIQICQLDEGNVCTGCGRSLGEIAEWSQAGVERKKQIRRLAQQRLETRNNKDTHG